MPIRSTSVAAKKSMKPFAAAQVDHVLDFIVRRGKKGATLEEIANGTRIKLQSVCPARLMLEKHGFVVDSGLRRPTSSGRKAIVWVDADLMLAP